MSHECAKEGGLKAVLASMMKALSVLAKYARRSTSSVAPRLSELDTKRYLTPFDKRRSKKPEPRREG